MMSESPASAQRSIAHFQSSATPSASVLDPGWEERQKLLADDGAASDLFGRSVALSGDTSLVGAVYDDDRGTDSGSAYVFEKVNGAWTQAAKLTADDGEAADNFGRVALSGDTALIGAYRDDDRGENSGSAYVFERVNGAWTQVAKLTADDGAPFDYFGQSVALSGDTALIGAPENDAGGVFDSGSAYVFEKVNGVWTQVAKLSEAPYEESYNEFGSSVALSGDSALIGVPYNDNWGENCGSAYVFEKVNDVWTRTAQLLAGREYDRFGGSVALSGDTALIGANGYGNGYEQNKGSAYVFEKVNGRWTRVAMLTAPGGEQRDYFGISVSLSGDTALIGVYQDDDRGRDSGSAYVFEKVNGAWIQAAKLTAVDGKHGDGLGLSVALSGDTALIGALYDDDRGKDSGSAYIFERTDVCTGNEAITGAKCKIKRGGVKQASAFMQGGIPFAIYTAVLDSGEVAQDEANNIGQARFLFRGENAPECGPNGVSACTVYKKFDCGC